MRAFTMWMTGESAAGKTTLAKLLASEIHPVAPRIVLIDGDMLRAGVCRDLDLTSIGRFTNVERAAHICRLLNDQGVSCIASLISPMAIMRRLARDIVGPEKFYLVWVHATRETLRARDPKGIYAAADAGKTALFHYEEPAITECVFSRVDTDIWPPHRCTRHLRARMEAAGIV